MYAVFSSKSADLILPVSFFSKSFPRVMQWLTNWGRITRSSRLRYRLVLWIKRSSKVSESDFFDIYFYIKLKNCINIIWYRYLISYYVQEKVYTVNILGLLEMEEKKKIFLFLIFFCLIEIENSACLPKLHSLNQAISFKQYFIPQIIIICKQRASFVYTTSWL